jgi:hypothetical protein
MLPSERVVPLGAQIDLSSDALGQPTACGVQIPLLTWPCPALFPGAFHEPRMKWLMRKRSEVPHGVAAHKVVDPEAAWARVPTISCA